MTAYPLADNAPHLADRGQLTSRRRLRPAGRGDDPRFRQPLLCTTLARLDTDRTNYGTRQQDNVGSTKQLILETVLPPNRLVQNQRSAACGGGGV